jgi:hypothetical protein
MENYLLFTPHSSSPRAASVLACASRILLALVFYVTGVTFDLKYAPAKFMMQSCEFFPPQRRQQWRRMQQQSPQGYRRDNDDNNDGGRQRRC